MASFWVTEALPLAVTSLIPVVLLPLFGKGSSINDVTALGGRECQGFCDNSTKPLVMKSVTMGGGGVKNDPNLRDVIYGRPLIQIMQYIHELYLFLICIHKQILSLTWNQSNYFKPNLHPSKCLHKQGCQIIKILNFKPEVPQIWVLLLFLNVLFVIPSLFWIGVRKRERG